MKAKIFLYLFIFAFMYAIFQFMNAKRYSEAKEKEIAELHLDIKDLKDEVAFYKNDNPMSKDDDGFSLLTNKMARSYFEDQNIDADSLAAQIESELISKNKADANHPLAPYSGLEGRFMHLNRIKVLNQKWILAEFTDGQYWSEAILSYGLDNQNNLQFDTLDGVLFKNN